MWGRFASVVQQLDERERQNKRKFRETPRMKCGFCGERRSECVCCEISTCHLPCRAGSDFCERHGGRVSCEGSLMTGYVCQICNKAEDGSRFHVCCNGVMCPACHDWAHNLRERQKPPIPDTTGTYAIQASPVVPLVPEVHVREADEPVVAWQPMSADIPCMLCNVVATHHYCDEHANGAENGAQPQQTALPELGSPVTAYVVIGARQGRGNEPFEPRYLGLYPVLADAEQVVRDLYSCVQHGIESLADAMVQPERYEMTVEEVQAICAECDEAVERAYEGTLWMNDGEEVVRIVEQVIQ